MTRWAYMLPAHESGVGLMAAIEDHATTAMPDVAPVWARYDRTTKHFRVDWRLLEQLRRNGIEPVIYAELPANPEAIAHGDLDDAIRLMGARARGALIRYLHEGNGTLFPWGGWPIPQYIDVYRHVGQLLHDEGARTIYCMAARGKRNDDLMARWPGDDVVDATGFTEFRRSDKERTPALQWAYPTSVLASHGHKVWVCETGAEASTQSRGLWMASLAEVKNVAVVCIFDYRIEFPLAGTARVDDWRWSRTMNFEWDKLPRGTM